MTDPIPESGHRRRRVRPAVVLTRRFASALAVLSFVLVAVGCSEPFGTLSPRVYLLRNAEEAAFWADPSTQSERVRFGRIIMRDDGSAEMTWRVEERLGEGAPRIVEFRSTWVFDVDGDRITFRTPECGEVGLGGGCGFSARLEARTFGSYLLLADRALFRRD